VSPVGNLDLSDLTDSCSNTSSARTWFLSVATQTDSNDSGEFQGKFNEQSSASKVSPFSWPLAGKNMDYRLSCGGICGNLIRS